MPLVEPRHLKAYAKMCRRSDCGDAVGVDGSLSSLLLDLPCITGYGKFLAKLLGKIVETVFFISVFILTFFIATSIEAQPKTLTNNSWKDLGEESLFQNRLWKKTTVFTFRLFLDFPFYHVLFVLLSFCLVNAMQSVYISCKVILYVIPRPWFSLWPSMLSNILIKLPILPLACTSWWTRTLCLFQFITCPLF